MAKLDEKQFIAALQKGGYSQDAINNAVQSYNSGAKTADIVNQLKQSKQWTNYIGTPVAANNNISKNTNKYTETKVGPVNAIASGSRGWDEWDYKANIDNDTDRQKQMLTNLKNYAVSNPQLFENRDEFNKYFKYDWRDASQQKLLDWSFDNYNKFWLNSNENKNADDRSEIASLKGNQLLANAEQNLADVRNTLQPAIDSLSPKYQKIYDAMEIELDRIKNDYSKLRELENQYQSNITKMTDQQKAGTAAWVASKLSSQWLGYWAISSAVTWVGNQFARRYNDNLNNHIERLMKLSDNVTTNLTNVGNTMWNITDKERAMLKDYNDKIIWYIDWVKTARDSMTNDIWKPYEDISDARIAWTKEASQTSAKRQNKLATYAEADNIDKRAMIADNLIQYLPEGISLSDDKAPYYQMIEQAVNDNPNDFSRAMYEAIDKLVKSWVKVWWSKWVGWVLDDLWFTEDTLFPDKK